MKITELLNENVEQDVSEISKPTLARYVKAAGKDVEQRSSSQSFASGKRGDPYNKADPTHADTRREKGVDIALRKLTKEGYKVMPNIDKDRYTDMSDQGLEGPFRLDSGKVVYYDPAVGKYYDLDTDMYLSHKEYDRHKSESIAEGAKSPAPGWMLKQDPELAKKVKAKTQGYKDLKKWAGKEVPKKDVAEAQFNSKQEVINHFVKQGKSAAAGASAWERGWRGHAPKKSAKAPVRSYHDDLDDKRYGSEEGVTEGWGAEKQARDLEPSNRAWAAMLDKYSGDDEMTEYLKMFRISNWSAKNAEEGALKWISHGKPLPDWYLDIKAGKRTHGYKLAETATAGSTSAGNVGVGAVYKNKPAKQAKNKDGTAKNALDIKANLLTGGSIKR